MDPASTLIARLEAIVGASRLHRHPLERSLFAKDAGMLRGRPPDAVVFPQSLAEVVSVVEVVRQVGTTLTVRGTGTGLVGGAVPDGGVMVVTTHLERILEVDPDARTAWVEPGVLTLDLTRHTARWGLRFAPDPSSQAACTIGGNVATNAGGSHALAEGATADHVLAVEIVTASGEVLELGGSAPDPSGLDLRAVVVGSEGTLGIVTRVLVRLTPDPPAVRTLLMSFPTIEQAAEAVSQIIARGVVPAALELMDWPLVQAVERFCAAGYPVEAAVLLAELTGHSEAIELQGFLIAEVARSCGSTEVRIARDEKERELLWKGRRAALGSLAQIAPNYCTHDIVVPRGRLAEAVGELHASAERLRLPMLLVSHAGDGNLHPMLVFDASEAEVLERVHTFTAETTALAARCGGTLSGEHGIGLEKRDSMTLFMTPADLDAQARLRDAFDPDHLLNPGKVLRERHGSRPSGLAPVFAAPAALARYQVDCPQGVPQARWVIAPPSLEEAAEAIRAAASTGSRVLPWGGGVHQGYGGRVEADVVLLTRELAGVIEWRPEDLVATVGAGTTVDELESLLATQDQTALLSGIPGSATVGGCVAAGVSGWPRLRFGPLRSRVLEVTLVTGDGSLVRNGARVVKNAAGYDLARLMVGSLGSLGLLGSACLKLWPRPQATATVAIDDPEAALRCLWQPWAVLEIDGQGYAYLAGTSAEVEQQATALGGTAREGHCWPDPLRSQIVAAFRVPSPQTRAAVRRLPDGSAYRAAFGVGEVLVGLEDADVGQLSALRAWAEQAGGSLVLLAAPTALYDELDPWGSVPPSLRLQQRVKAAFDPAGVMVPGRLPGGL